MTFTLASLFCINGNISVSDIRRSEKYYYSRQAWSNILPYNDCSGFPIILASFNQMLDRQGGNPSGLSNPLCRVLFSGDMN
jgi:hypothetical protein